MSYRSLTCLAESCEPAVYQQAYERTYVSFNTAPAFSSMSPLRISCLISSTALAMNLDSSFLFARNPRIKSCSVRSHMLKSVVPGEGEAALADIHARKQERRNGTTQDKGGHVGRTRLGPDHSGSGRSIYLKLNLPRISLILDHHDPFQSSRTRDNPCYSRSLQHFLGI